MERSIEVGSIVYSRAGRDSGRYYVVMEVVDDDFVTIADGKKRKAETPKKKKIKHLKITMEIAEDIKNKLLSKEIVYDAHIKKALEKYN